MAPSKKPSLEHTIRENGVSVVFLAGDLDAYGIQIIKADFAKALSNRTKSAVICLKDVKFLSSAALAMLVAHAQSISRGGGKLCVAEAQPLVAQVFKRAGFASVFPICDTVDEALKQCE